MPSHETTLTPLGIQSARTLGHAAQSNAKHTMSERVRRVRTASRHEGWAAVNLMGSLDLAGGRQKV